MKPTLYFLRGIPASGKSTWAIQEVKESNGKTIRVNKDDIRAMCHGSIHTKGNEKETIQIQDSIVLLALQSGKNVIVDNTHLNPVHEGHFKGIAKAHGATFKLIDFPCSLEEAIKRDAARERSVGEAVVTRMYYEYQKLSSVKVEYNPSLPDCYIFDIDGTLALMQDRSPYDWKRVGEDLPNMPVVNIARRLETDYAIILMSGRDAVCREETRKWLKLHNIPYNSLYMRPEGNTEKDTVVKKRLYEENIKDIFNVLTIFDDRDCVVAQWRQLGLPCFQVAEGNF